MPGEIAEAFVLIRPNSTGFKQETEASAKGAALGAAKVFAAAFAGVKLFDFAKSAVSEAAAVQKSTEGITQGFGESSKAVLDFADTAGSKLGISKQASEGFSATLAIQAKNLGISQEKAAEMTVGLQKLAGSIGQIKGIDPASTFDKLSVALLGNTRGLKSLGISADSASISQAALDAHIVKATVNQAEVTKKTEEYRAAVQVTQQAVDKYGKGSAEAAKAQNAQALAQQAVQKAVAGTVPKLDAAQKAQAIYAVATKHLGDFQSEAAKHSEDLTNQQQRLSAEWQNAKEAIGSALLPAVTSLTGEMLSLLQSIERNKGGIERAFGDAATVLTPVTFAVKELAHNMQITGPILATLVASIATYKTVTTLAAGSTAAWSTAVKIYNTAAILATEGTSGLAAAQKAQAAGLALATNATQAQTAASQELAGAMEAEDAAGQQSIATKTEEASATAAVVTAAQAEAGAVAEVTLSQEAETVASTEAAAATEVLNAALLSNPFGLVAVGVSALVGGLIGYKVLAGQSSGATDQLAGDLRSLHGSLEDVKGATNDAHDALLGLFGAEVSTKQSASQLVDANHALAAAIRSKASANTIYKDQLAVVNALEKDGQKNTSTYADANKKLAEDRAKLGAATKKESDAEIAAASASANHAQTLDDLRAKMHDAQKAAEGLTSKADGLSTALGDKLKKAATDTLAPLQTLNKGIAGAAPPIIVSTSKLIELEHGMHQLSITAHLTAEQITKKADADQKMADQITKLNPKLGEQAQKLVDSERAAADAAKKTELMDLAAQDLTVQLGKTPTQHQINVYYKNNLKDLKDQAKQLGDAVNNLPSSKVIDVSVVRTGGNVDTRKAAGGGITPGAVSLTGEQGPEISVASTGRQIISHSESVGLFTNLAKAIDNLSAQLAAAKAAPAAPASGSPPIVVNVNGAQDPAATAKKVVDEIALAVRR